MDSFNDTSVEVERWNLSALRPEAIKQLRLGEAAPRYSAARTEKVGRKRLQQTFSEN
jgi:hypothetical protein